MVINFYGLSNFLRRDCVVIGNIVLFREYVLVLKTFRGFEIWEYLKFKDYGCYVRDNVFKADYIAIRYALELNKRHTSMYFFKGGENNA